MRSPEALVFAAAVFYYAAPDTQEPPNLRFCAIAPAFPADQGCFSAQSPSLDFDGEDKDARHR